MQQAEFIVELRELTLQQRQMVNDALLSVLDSPHFRKSKRYPAVLDFAVRNTLEGNLDVLRERVIGAAIFGRPADYDTSIDPVVRIAAGEVRKRMALYFAEHPDVPVRIHLPAGHYRAEFHFRYPVTNGALLEESPAYSGQVQQAPTVQLQKTQVQKVEVQKTEVQDQSPSNVVQPRSSSPGWGRRATVRAAALAALLLLVGGGATFWLHARDLAKQNLWAPVLAGNMPALIVLGEGPDRSSLEYTAAKASVYAPKQVTLGNALAGTEICNVFYRYKHDCKTLPAQSAKLDDLLNKSVVLIGAFDNEWTQRLLTPYRFQFQFDPPVASPASAHIPRARKIVDRAHPETDTTWKVGSEGADQEFDHEYAIVGRFHSDITDGMAVVIAGIGPLGTSGAATYACAPSMYSELLQLAPKDWKGLNFESVLQVDIVQGTVGHVKVAAAQFW